MNIQRELTKMLFMPQLGLTDEQKKAMTTSKCEVCKKDFKSFTGYKKCPDCEIKEIEKFVR